MKKLLFATLACIVTAWVVSLALNKVEPAPTPRPIPALATGVEVPTADYKVDSTKQKGKETGWWDMVDMDPDEKAVVRLFSPVGTMGSGSVIEYGEFTTILTAYHVGYCPWFEPTYTVVYSGGRVQQIVNPSIWYRLTDDVLVMRFKSRPGLEIEPLKMSSVFAHPGDTITSYGYGGGSEGVRKFTSQVVVGSNDTAVFHDCHMLAGDSGGPVLNGDGEIVGIHSYGMYSFISTTLDTMVVWPGVSIGLQPILENLKERDQSLEAGIEEHHPLMFQTIVVSRVPSELVEDTDERVKTSEGHHPVP